MRESKNHRTKAGFSVSGGTFIIQSDQFLIDKIREHDAAAFETLWARYSESIRRHIIRIVQDESAAEDLVQETFLRIWISADRWDGRGNFKAWLFRIATNLALNYLRTLRRRKQQPLEIPPDDFDDADEYASDPDWMIDTSLRGPDVMLEQAEQSNLLWRLVEELPEDKREVLHLVYQKEMNLREVAAEIGIPEGTVKSRLHYSIRRLAKEWKEITGEYEEDS